LIVRQPRRQMLASAIENSHAADPCRAPRTAPRAMVRSKKVLGSNRRRNLLFIQLRRVPAGITLVTLVGACSRSASRLRRGADLSSSRRPQFLTFPQVLHASARSRCADVALGIEAAARLRPSLSFEQAPRGRRQSALGAGRPVPASGALLPASPRQLSISF